MVNRLPSPETIHPSNIKKQPRIVTEPTHTSKSTLLSTAKNNYEYQRHELISESLSSYPT